MTRVEGRVGGTTLPPDEGFCQPCSGVMRVGRSWAYNHGAEYAAEGNKDPR